METGHGIEYRQLHMEDYLQEIPAEQGKVTLTKEVIVDRLGYSSMSDHYLKVRVNYLGIQYFGDIREVDVKIIINTGLYGARKGIVFGIF